MSLAIIEIQIKTTLRFHPTLVRLAIIKKTNAKCQRLTPAILITWEAAISRFEVWGQPGQIVHKTLPPSPPNGLEVWLKG
jgi:hypothetical protein